MLVLDASTALNVGQFERGLASFADDLVAPPLLWSEARSSLHELVWRGQFSPQDARRLLGEIDDVIRPRAHRRLGERAWAIADELGWAKTYDAEYVALAALLACRLVTSDARLRRSTAGLGFVVGPHEL